MEENSKNKEKYIQIRVREDIKEELIDKASKYGFKSLSEYLIFVGLNVEIHLSIKKD